VRLLSSRRVALVIAIPVVLLAATVFATANVQRNAALRSAREQVASQRLLTAMLDQETGVRGYFQTREELFLEPWYKGAKEFETSLAELRSSLKGNYALQQMLSDQAQRAADWHRAAQTEIFNLEQGGHAPSNASARQAKEVVDGFRAAHATFDSSLEQERRHAQTVATAIAIAAAVVLAALLAAAGLLLTRRMANNEQKRQHDQSTLRELLQASESERESRGLLIRHVERMIGGTGAAAVLNRNNSDDRLELTGGAVGSALEHAKTEQMRPRSCLAVRLSHAYDHDPGTEGLQQCEICGAVEGATTCEPLLVGGKVIGSVLVASRKPLSSELRARLRESVAQAAPILASQRNLAIAEGRAASDALSGLPNRRAADEALKRMAAHAGRSVTPLTAILIDLDRFKQLNDRHGHESGDRALAMVGRIISSTIRTSDFAARFGGEEFLVLLPDTDGDAALLVAEKLRREIERAELTGIGSLTASLGLAVLPTDAGEPDELLRKADRALYSAKEGGRNRVHAFVHSAVEDPRGHGESLRAVTAQQD
jgi:diguanylate cyclase (GGDEF)-like protein